MNAPEDLLIMAKAAWAQAYAPYSGFKVGAALRTAAGSCFSGANVENASFGLTRCAEQSAIQAMITAGQRDFLEIVVYTEAAEPASPCGACRQILFEFSPNARVYLVNHLVEVKALQVKDLLPWGFSLANI